jgi:phi LC3 family holin
VNWKSRLQNYGFWIGVVALLLLLLQRFGVEFVADSFQGLVDIILGILVLLGIINDPTTTKKGFGDD